jgi:hypothetical protein
MIRGKFLAQDDIDVAGHRILNWKWLDDLPTDGAADGQVLIYSSGSVTWATISASGVVSVDWPDIQNKPTEFPPEAHTQDWGTITGKPTFVNSVTGGLGISVSAATGANIEIANSIQIDATEPTGFIEGPGTFTSTMAITNNRTFTIEPLAPATEFSFYVKGQKFTKTSTQSVTFDDTEGIWLFYFDEDGVLQASQDDLTGLIFTENAICGVAYWNAGDNEVIYFGEERHGMVMDGATHRYLHDTEGTRFIDGHALGDIAADGSGDDNADAVFSTEAGEIADEDLFLSAEARTTGDGLYTYYKEGATGTWRRTGPSPYPVVYNGTWDRIGYNNFNGTSSQWEQADPGDNDFVLAHIYRVNSVTQPYIAVQGQAEYPNLGAARDGAAEELAQLVTSGLPFQEFYPLGTIIYQTNDGAYDNDISARIRSTEEGDDYVDWRFQRLTPGSGPGDHGALSGLTDKHHPTTALQQTGAVTNNVLAWDGTDWNPTGTLNLSGNLILDGNIDIGGDIAFAVGGAISGCTTLVAQEISLATGSITYDTNRFVFDEPVRVDGFADINDYLDVDGDIFCRDDRLYMNYGQGGGDFFIYGSTASTNLGVYLQWDESASEFEFNRRLRIEAGTDNLALALVSDDANCQIQMVDNTGYVNITQSGSEIYLQPGGNAAFAAFNSKNTRCYSHLTVDGDVLCDGIVYAGQDSTGDFPLRLNSDDTACGMILTDSDGAGDLYYVGATDGGKYNFRNNDNDFIMELSELECTVTGEFHDRLRDVRTSDKTCTSTTATTCGLEVNVGVNAYYRMKSLLLVEGTTALSSDVQIGVSKPGSSLLYFTNNITAGGNEPTTTKTQLTVNGTATLMHSVEGVFFTGATSGTVSLQMNLTGAGGSVNLLRGSTLELTRLDKP